jgi:hypothetical protein
MQPQKTPGQGADHGAYMPKVPWSVGRVVNTGMPLFDRGFGC